MIRAARVIFLNEMYCFVKKKHKNDISSSVMALCWLHGSRRPDDAKSPQNDLCKHTATHLFVSAILMLDQDGGFYLLLLLMASCLLTQRKKVMMASKHKKGLEKNNKKVRVFLTL